MHMPLFSSETSVGKAIYVLVIAALALIVVIAALYISLMVLSSWKGLSGGATPIRASTVSEEDKLAILESLSAGATLSEEEKRNTLKAVSSEANTSLTEDNKLEMLRNLQDN